MNESEIFMGKAEKKKAEFFIDTIRDSIVYLYPDRDTRRLDNHFTFDTNVWLEDLSNDNPNTIGLFSRQWQDEESIQETYFEGSDKHLQKNREKQEGYSEVYNQKL